MKKAINKVNSEIAFLRNKWGEEICTDAVIEDDGNITYIVQPDDITGYVVEIDPIEMQWRRCGLGKGCFWTDWEEWR